MTVKTIPGLQTLQAEASSGVWADPAHQGRDPLQGPRQLCPQRTKAKEKPPMVRARSLGRHSQGRGKRIRRDHSRTRTAIATITSEHKQNMNFVQALKHHVWPLPANMWKGCFLSNCSISLALIHPALDKIR